MASLFLSGRRYEKDNASFRSHTEISISTDMKVLSIEEGERSEAGKTKCIKDL